MKRQFLLPDPGEGLLEAEIVAWRVTEGQSIEVNDVLVEIETAKSLVELPSPYAGTVTSLLVAEGTTVEVGSPIVEIDDGEDEAEESGPNLVGYGASDAAPTRRRRRVQSAPERSEASEALSAAYDQHEPGRRADEVHPATTVHAKAEGDPLPTPGRAPAESQLVLASDANSVKAKPPAWKDAWSLMIRPCFGWSSR